MHVRNRFTGARPGDHVSISSYTEPKLYRLFAFKAKTYNSLDLREEESSAKHLFHRRGWVTAPPRPTHTAEPSAGPSEEAGGNEMHMSAVLLLFQLLSEALLLQPPAIPGPEDMPGGGTLCSIFSQTSCASESSFLNQKKVRDGQGSESSQHYVFAPRLRAV